MDSLQCDSEEINDPDQIDTMVLEYYRRLYEKGDSKKSTNSATANIFLRNMTKLDDDIINMIDAPITTLDLYNTLRSCRDSAPGPDGIPYSIIKLTWSIFGPALVNAWNYSLLTSELTNSHTDSYLKLLPKAGKNLLLLKNWRPITLSNCDFKVITKTLASRLTNGLSNMISHNQTAYIKGRQITDNLHLLQYAIEKAVEIDESTSIVSLDAEKAFDSIEHWYIREILDKIGLSKFKLLFDIIYRDQKVSIQLNSRCAGTYNIKNGVKQGDALSCILFILGIEPLLKNISADNYIKGVTIEGIEIPKIISYADDVACIIKPGNSNLQQIFNHYQEMTDSSGLRLNADKTELISWLGNDQSYKIIYEGNEYNIAPCDNMKVNGLQIGFNLEDMRVINFEKVYSSVDRQLITWSNRYLSLLAKILIFKTFGLSQILFVASTTMFSKAQDNKLTTLIYKFLWNNNMERKKAPDRLKRQILHCEIKNLGFGMLDFRDIVDSIRIKTVLRLLNNNNHPLHAILSNSITRSVINIKSIRPIRPSLDKAILQINKIWSQAMTKDQQEIPRSLIKIYLNEYIGNLICPKFHKQRMVMKHKHDKLGEI